MDNLDKISVLVIAVLTAILVTIGMDYKSEAGSNSTEQKTRGMIRVSEIPSEEIERLKVLVTNNNIKKAEITVAALLEKYPYDGEPHMVMGDIMMRRQDPVAAMYSYREAVDLDPDYVDKKTPVFQGRKIKNTIDEAKVVINSGLTDSPDDEDMKKAKKTMYYLLRKLAGSCG